MCGRYGNSKPEKIKARFNVTLEFAPKPHFNIAPTQETPVIAHGKASLIKWGLKPIWSKSLLINAKSETLDSSKTFKKAFQTNRCLIPADCFYEWKAVGTGKQPYLIKLKSDDLFGFAGLLLSEDGHERFAIITTSPNELMVDIHNRMPAILTKEAETDWLNPDITDESFLKRILVPYSSSEMVAHPISSLVNNPRNDVSEIIKPL